MGAPVKLAKPKVCPCCKRLLPESLTIGGARRRRLLDYVGNHPEGVTVWQIIDAIYWDDPNGGPDKHNCISVMVKQMNRTLIPQGYKIRGTGGPGSRYFLEIAP